MFKRQEKPVVSFITGSCVNVDLSGKIEEVLYAGQHSRLRRRLGYDLNIPLISEDVVLSFIFFLS